MVIIAKDIQHKTSLVAQRVTHLLAMQETRVGSLGREDPLEKEMAAHSIYIYSIYTSHALFSGSVLNALLI